jgi:hypothetical protein
MRAIHFHQGYRGCMGSNWHISFLILVTILKFLTLVDEVPLIYMKQKRILDAASLFPPQAMVKQVCALK